MKILIFLFISFLTAPVFAEKEISYLQKLAVFPIAGWTGEVAEDAWWRVREVLTKDQRFFVASKRLMTNRGILNAKKTLKPADAIILGRILDAQGLVTLELNERTLFFRVYETENGIKFFESKFVLHPTIPIAEQLNRAVNQLTEQFLSDIPYHGYLDLKKDEPNTDIFVVQKGKLAVEPGDPVELFRAFNSSDEILISSTTKIEIIAKGKVISISNDQVQVEFQSHTDPLSIKDKSLARFPKLLKNRINDQNDDDRDANLSIEYLANDMRSKEEFTKKHGSDTSTLAWIFNLALVVLLFF